MKYRISVALNVVLSVGIVALWWSAKFGEDLREFYYRKTVSTVVAGSVSELDKGNTKLVRDALALIWESGDAKQQVLEKAGEKLGVIIRHSQPGSPDKGP